MNKPAARLSYVEEDIEVKPSTELIADEYEHFQNSCDKIEVHTFASDKDGDADVKLLSEALSKCGIEIKEEKKHNLDRDNYNDILDDICKHSDKLSGLILFFSGCSSSDGHLDMFDGSEMKNVDIQEIWRKFDSHNCIALKNKPKIFIFEIHIHEAVQTDSTLGSTSYELAYDTPAEADMLIVYNKVNDNTINEFMELLHDDIKEYGENEDIISLITCIVSTHIRPLLISTMTRKFYFTASDVRGHHLIIEKKQKELAAHLNEVKETLNNHYTEKREKRNIFSSFRFGKKSKENREKSSPETENPEPEIKPTINKPNSQSNIANEAIRPSTSTGRRPSVSTRNRKMSSTESESGRSTSRRPSERDKTKPIWKP